MQESSEMRTCTWRSLPSARLTTPSRSDEEAACIYERTVHQRVNMGKKSSSKSPSKDLSKEVGADSGKHAQTELAAAGDLTLPEKTSQRKFSLIVWGATGFTGSLVCRQLAETYPVRLSFRL